MISHQATIQAGCLLEDDLVLVATSLDDISRDYDTSYSRLATYKISRREHPWRFSDRDDWLIVSVCAWTGASSQQPFRCVLSREGQVNLYGPGGQPDHSFQIPEAGVFGEAATGLGYVNRIRAVGDGLYVCGQSRQVWRFEWDGRDLAAGRWVDMAGAMRQPPMPDPPDDEDAFERWLDDNDAVDFVDIAGPSERDLYAVGDEAWHWDGRRWAPLSLPTDEPLAAIKVMSAQLIYIVGHNGTVLAGNAREGFRDLSTLDDNQNFTAVEWFADRLFLASNLGLFTLEPGSDGRIRRHASELKPELQDTHQLEARDGVLWSFGFKDLAYFDGRRWTRVDHPDNPPIR